MKINQWTLGLAAVGVVSLASAVKADESTMNAVQTALSSTTISGYVDTSVEWNLGNKDNEGHNYIPFRNGKSDGFNLNVVKLTIEKPMDESEWAAGYKVDLLFGPDAVGYNGSVDSSEIQYNYYNGYSGADFGIKQAYVALRTPVGNGIDWKVGVFDTTIGYETFESGNNPNFTRSWGYAIEPTEHTGILATYRVNDIVSVAAGVANTLSPGINNRPNPDYVSGETWHKTYLASVALTAPQDLGFLSGSTLYAGVVGGLNNGGDVEEYGADQVNYYTGATLNTPVTGLKAGLAFDYVQNAGGIDKNNQWMLGAYASFQATEKLSLHGRAEYGKAVAMDEHTDGNLTELTGTVQYDLWKNVISRVELRWDEAYVKNDSTDSSVGLFANLIYKF